MYVHMYTLPVINTTHTDKKKQNYEKITIATLISSYRCLIDWLGLPELLSSQPIPTALNYIIPNLSCQTDGF